MSFVKEKVSYLKGLFDGLKIEGEEQRKLLSAMIDAMDAIADAIDDNEATIDELDECISDIYESMDEMEESMQDLFEDDDDESFDDEEYIEIECPHCKDIIYCDQEMLSKKGDFICPSCNEAILKDEE